MCKCTLMISFPSLRAASCSCESLAAAMHYAESLLRVVENLEHKFLKSALPCCKLESITTFECKQRCVTSTLSYWSMLNLPPEFSWMGSAACERCHILSLARRGLEGLWFLRAFAPYVQLSLHRDSLRPQKTIAVPQGLRDGIDQLLLRITTTKSSSQQKVLLVPSSGSCSSTAFSNF